MTVHELKTWPQYFRAVLSGEKPFEVRKEDDRKYAPGDILLLREYNPNLETFTGVRCIRLVTYTLREPQFVRDGYVIMGLSEDVPVAYQELLDDF